MIGRRMGAAAVVVAAVTVGGVAGAMIGIPGLSGASSSSTAALTGGSGKSSSDTPGGERHAHGFRGIAVGGKGVLDAAAKALNLSTEDLLSKVSDGKTTIADVAEQQKVDVQTVIDAMDAVAKQDITDLVNNPFPAPPHFDGGGRHGPKDGEFGFGLRGSIDSLAKVLGISSDELGSDLRDGKSIADIAKAKGVDVDKVIESLVSDAKSRIDSARKDGHLSADQATKLETDLHDMISNLVNNSLPKGLGHFGGFGRRGPGGFGPGGFGPGGPGPGDLPALPTPPAAT